MAAGDIYTVVAAQEAAEPVPRGLYALEQPSSGDAALVPVLGARRYVLPGCSTSVREDGDVDLKAQGYRLRLRPVGKSRLPQSEWEDIKTLLTGRSAELVRLPAGSALQITVQEVEILRGGALVRYREKGRSLASLQLTASSFAAFRRTDRALEVRSAQGTGLRIRVRDCVRCGAKLDNVKSQTIDGAEHCAKCALLITREVRSAAQKRVGVCRGCLFYGKAAGGTSVERVGVCLNQTRVKALGQLTDKPVVRCVYRKARQSGVKRRTVDLEP